MPSSPAGSLRNTCQRRSEQCRVGGSNVINLHSANHRAPAGMAFTVAILAILIESCASSGTKPTPISPVSVLPERGQIPAEWPSPVKNEVMRYPLQYPPSARRKGIGGYVMVQFVLPDNGFPTEIVVVLSEPSGFFEDSCVAYARRLHFDVPAVWVEKYPGRRLEIACVYEVIGSPKPPVLREFPGMFTSKVSTQWKG
jgi:TonB family protein